MIAGAIIMWPSIDIPDGWYVCDGSDKDNNDNVPLLLALMDDSGGGNPFGEPAADFNADYVTDTLTETAHGLVDDDVVYLEFTTSPQPTAIDQWQPYYVVGATANTFQLAETIGGTALADAQSFSADIYTQFTLPDMRQAFPLGLAASGTGSTLGGTGGTIDHTHTVDPASTASGLPSSTIAVDTNADGTTAQVGDDIHSHATDIASTATSSANPPFVALNFIISRSGGGVTGGITMGIQA